VLNISGKYNSLVIAKNLAIDINEFSRLNPGFDNMMASGSPYDLRLPGDKMDLFVRNKYIILNECVQILLSDVDTSTKTIYSRHNFKQRK
jgi:membrane-bound lytic murein transglycosylase D